MGWVPNKGIDISWSSHREVAMRTEEGQQTVAGGLHLLKISFKSVGTPTSRDHVAFPTWKVEPFQNCSSFLSSLSPHHSQWCCPNASTSSSAPPSVSAFKRKDDPYVPETQRHPNDSWRQVCLRDLQGHMHSEVSQTDIY